MGQHNDSELDVLWNVDWSDVEEGEFIRNARKLLPLQRNDIGRWHAWHDDRPLSAIFNIKYKPVSKNVYDNKLVALDAWIGFPCGPL